MPAEPYLWQILDRVRVNLAAIVAGADYHYAPDAVYVVTSWADDRLWDPSASSTATIYGVRRVDRTHQRDTTGDNTTGAHNRASVDVAVLVARRHVPSRPGETPTGVLVVERMLADVLRALTFGDPGLGVLDVEDVASDGGADDTVFEDSPTGWASGELIFRVAYTYPSVRP